MVTIKQLLKTMVAQGASDLHISTGSPPVLRIDEELIPMDLPILGPLETRVLAYEVLTDVQKDEFEKMHELDLSFGINGLSRFRANVYLQRGAVGMAIRAIRHQIPSFSELGLPPAVASLADKPRGLILVTGPTGSGKSTTLAAMIDKINSERTQHIVTIEDPIEYVYKNKMCLVTQRQVKSDTFSFQSALKSILRQDPDVVLIGEMRDVETIEAALVVAETGHLTLATLHTNNCMETINRVIDVFPSHQQTQVRTQLSFVLEGVLSQQLLPRLNHPGRVLALEIMIPNAAIRNLIRENKVHQIYTVMQTGQEKHVMQTLNQSLFALYSQGLISYGGMIARSTDPEELKEMMKKTKGS